MSRRRRKKSILQKSVAEFRQELDRLEINKCFSEIQQESDDDNDSGDEVYAKYFCWIERKDENSLLISCSNIKEVWELEAGIDEWKEHRNRLSPRAVMEWEKVFEYFSTAFASATNQLSFTREHKSKLKLNTTYPIELVRDVQLESFFVLDKVPVDQRTQKLTNLVHLLMQKSKEIDLCQLNKTAILQKEKESIQSELNDAQSRIEILQRQVARLRRSHHGGDFSTDNQADFQFADSHDIVSYGDSVFDYKYGSPGGGSGGGPHSEPSSLPATNAKKRVPKSLVHPTQPRRKRQKGLKIKR